MSKYKEYSPISESKDSAILSNIVKITKIISDFKSHIAMEISTICSGQEDNLTASDIILIKNQLDGVDNFKTLPNGAHPLISSVFKVGENLIEEFNRGHSRDSGGFFDNEENRKIAGCDSTTNFVLNATRKIIAERFKEKELSPSLTQVEDSPKRKPYDGLTASSSSSSQSGPAPKKQKTDDSETKASETPDTTGDSPLRKSEQAAEFEKFWKEVSEKCKSSQLPLPAEETRPIFQEAFESYLNQAAKRPKNSPESGSGSILLPSITKSGPTIT